MMTCAFCKKKVLIDLIMTIYKVKATDIAKEINVSDSLVRKHIEGDRYCQDVDVFLIEKCFGIKVKGSINE